MRITDRPRWILLPSTPEGFRECKTVGRFPLFLLIPKKRGGPVTFRGDRAASTRWIAAPSHCSSASRNGSRSFPVVERLPPAAEPFCLPVSGVRDAATGSLTASTSRTGEKNQNESLLGAAPNNAKSPCFLFALSTRVDIPANPSRPCPVAGDSIKVWSRQWAEGGPHPDSFRATSLETTSPGWTPRHPLVRFHRPPGRVAAVPVCKPRAPSAGSRGTCSTAQSSSVRSRRAG